MTAASDPSIHAVLDFWFGAPGSSGYGAQRAEWWTTDPDFDARVRDALGPVLPAARSGALEGWGESPLGATALVLVLDQAPRNLFRGSGAAFASDGHALAVTERAVARGFHTRLIPVMAQFLMMPMMHAEDIIVQTRAVPLFEALAIPGATQAAHEHRAIIARFGRFPHRNAVLGRADTAAERAFLNDPGRPAFAGGDQRSSGDPDPDPIQ
jgi:uncharacterized protein (DUF924 family)